MAQSGGSEAVSCISSEEDLQRMIELGSWYDSEEESSSEAEDTDSGSDRNHDEISVKGAWFWSVNRNEEDPAFMKTELSVPRSHREIVEDLLSQLTDQEEEEGHSQEEADLGTQTASATNGQVSVGESVPDLDTANETLQSTQAIFDEGTSVDPERPKYYYIAYEILTSERTYVQNLRLLEKVVHGAVKTARMTKRSVLPENARKDIFLNIGELYALTFDLLQELEERIKHWEPNAVVADAIAKRALFFKLYSMYSERFDNAQVAYSKWLKTSKQFADLINMIESGPLCKGLPVSSFMLCPIQRIPRYKLLLEDYLRHLPKDHPDVINTEAALAAISEAARHMNSRITDLESQALVMRIQQRFAGKDNLVAPGRKYIGRGLVDFIPSGRKKQRILFLFSDILLIAASAAHGRYKIRHKISLKNLLISTLEPSSALRNGFCIAETGMNKPFRFCTRSQEERNRWIRKLNTAKTENSEHFTINSRSKYATVLNDPEAHSSIMEVLKDPGFEHNQPSWMRTSLRRSRSLQVAHSTGMLAVTAVGSATPTTATTTTTPSPLQLGRDEVDQPGTDGWVEVEEEVITEFQDEDNREKKQSLVPGIDNSLSCYMNQRSVDGKIWRRRWFVLTNRILICYDSHLHDEAVGAMPLAGYTLSLPTEGDNVKRYNVMKLTHSECRTYFFQSPSSYDFERWCAILRELLES